MLSFVTDNLLIVLLLAAAIWFTIRTRGVQFRMIVEMLRLLASSGKTEGRDKGHKVSSFQAFAVSIASRVGTGNLAGVATAIVIGGPGAVFWMWVIALLGSASAFIESTLAQMYKVRGEKSFMGGPAYYILQGTGKRWWAVTFAILITLTFGLAFNSVQANTISSAFHTSFGISPTVCAVVLAVATLVIIWGGIQSIARFSQIIVPFMALAYIAVAIIIICLNITNIPSILRMIVENAFGVGQAVGGTMGMAVVMGIKRGLFSNEAGEGSAPNVAATASTSHPVKQGLIQSLGVFTDTLIICTCTAMIILCAGGWTDGYDGIALTQYAIDHQLNATFPGIDTTGYGASFISIAIFFFAFTSIVANYYYGETNLQFICKSRTLIYVYRLCVGGMVALGALSSLELVWSLADLTMALMTICNLAAIVWLGKEAIDCLHDYQDQHRKGLDPTYRNPRYECWK